MDADGSHFGSVLGTESKKDCLKVEQSRGGRGGFEYELHPSCRRSSGVSEIKVGGVVVDKVHLQRRAGAVNGVLGTGCVCRAKVKLGKVELIAAMRKFKSVKATDASVGRLLR